MKLFEKNVPKNVIDIESAELYDITRTSHNLKHFEDKQNQS